MILTIAQKELGSNVVALELAGIITLGRSCSEIEWEVDKLVEKGVSKAIFDLTKVTRIDSAGLGIIVMSCGKLKKAGGDLRLVGVQENVRSVFAMTQVDKVVGMFDSTEAAMAGF
jgi:anti-sigma B factor antagonist